MPSGLIHPESVRAALDNIRRYYAIELDTELVGGAEILAQDILGEIPPNPYMGEITHVATVMTSGLVDVDAVRTVPFGGSEAYDRALDWVRDIVMAAHGEVPNRYETAGGMTVVTSPGGPTRGWIIEV
jgi:hypothetical protein